MTAQSRPLPLWLALAVAAWEVVALVGYAISIVVLHAVQGTEGATGSDVSPWVLVATYLAFAGLIGAVLLALWRGSGGARTPYLLTQAFALVVAQALVNGGETGEVVAGWAMVALAVAGAAGILTPAASRGLNLHR